MPNDELNTSGQEPLNEFDTSAEQKELDAINAELEQLNALWESNFSEHFAANKSPELDELYFENPKAFADEFQKMQNAFYDEQIGSKRTRAGELQSSIKQKQEFGVIDGAMKEFQSKHPDVNVKELVRFFNEELPPRKVAELEALPPQEFFEAIYSLYQSQMNGDEPKKEKKLPQQLSGVPSSDAGSARGSELPFSRM